MMYSAMCVCVCVCKERQGFNVRRQTELVARINHLSLNIKDM